MPTGYTASVCDGKITDFPTFALSCARAFGALIDMREEPIDAALPAEIKPKTSYYEESAAKHEARLAELSAMTPEEATAAAKASYESAMASHNKYEADKRAEADRLTAMLKQVHAWEPPSPDHVEMKKFMLEQLTISLPGDYRPTVPALLNGEDWRVKEIVENKRGLEYDRKHIREEIERAKRRDGWLKSLRKSLEAVPVT